MDNKTNDNRKINKWAFWPAIIILLAFILAGVLWTEQVGAVMTKLLYAMADYFGAYINLLSLTFIILAVVFLIGRYGDVVIGEQGFCSGPWENLSSTTCQLRRPLESRLPEPQASLPWPRPCGTGVLYSTVCMQFAELHLQSSVITAERAYPLIPLWNVLQVRRDHG